MHTEVARLGLEVCLGDLFGPEVGYRTKKVSRDAELCEMLLGLNRQGRRGLEYVIVMLLLILARSNLNGEDRGQGHCTLACRCIDMYMYGDIRCILHVHTRTSFRLE